MSEIHGETIQIVLLGQPEFRDKLATAGLEQLRQRVIATHHLDAMDEAEVEAYLRHRLGVVGWQGRPDFAPEAITALHAQSGGIPRRVNQLANRLMLQAALENSDMIAAEAVETVAADMGEDAAPVATSEEKVLPLRAARPPVAEPTVEAASHAPVTNNPAVEQRMAALEARAEEQEAMLRRVLTLLVDWVENASPETAYRTHAA